MKTLPDKSSTKVADEMMLRLGEEIKAVEDTREEILKACIAKYGYDPDHLIQLQGRNEHGQLYWHVVHLNHHQMTRMRDIYLMNCVVKEQPITRWQKFCLWLAGVRLK